MTELKKIIHVMRRFVPEKWGGTESVVFNLSKELIASGCESPVFCTSMFSEAGMHRLGKVSIYRFSYVFPWLGLSAEARKRLALKGGSPLSLPLFWALLCENNISLIHTHVPLRLGGMARTAAKLKRIPYVISVHGGHFTLPQDQINIMTEPFRGRLEWGKAFGSLLGSRRVLDDADAIICVGAIESEAVKEKYPNKPVFYVPNGVDLDRFSTADGRSFREKYGFLPNEKLVLCVSRFDPQKNQVGLVRAFAEFAKQNPDHRLVLIGAVAVEAYYAEVMREIEQQDIADKVTIVQGLRPDDLLLPSAYKAAEMFILPSVHEPFGIVILEAWAAGLPVIASRVGGIPGFATHEENILMVEPQDQRGWVDAMQRLGDDIVLRADLSRRAYGEVAMRYTWEKITERYREIYNQIMNMHCNYSGGSF